MRLCKVLFVSLSLFVLTVPVVFAQQSNFKFFGPLVPVCGDKNVCTVCDIFKLLQNAINFGLSVMVFVALAVLVWGGIQMLLAGASPKQLESGKKKVTRALGGIAIVFVAWLLIDTFIKLLAGQNLTGGAGQIPRLNGIGPWNLIECEAPAFPTKDTSERGHNASDIQKWADEQGLEGQGLKNPAGSGTCATFTPEEEQDIADTAARYGVDPNLLKAVISKESGGNPNAQSRDNDGGSSYGLGQMRLETAQQLDPSATIEKLKDPKYNIDVSGRYLSQLQSANGGNTDLTLAAYNGGPNANKPSVNCANDPSKYGGKMRRWECPWDDNAHTLPNKRPGHPGYGITRDYVPSVDNLQSQFASGQCQ